MVGQASASSNAAAGTDVALLATAKPRMTPEGKKSSMGHRTCQQNGGTRIQEDWSRGGPLCGTCAPLEPQQDGDGNGNA